MKDYPFGLRVTGYRSSNIEHNGDYVSSELDHITVYTRTELVRVLATWLEDYDEFILLEWLDDGRETARVGLQEDTEFTVLIREARGIQQHLADEAKQLAAAEEASAARRFAEALEKAERTNYERLKKKFEG